MRRECRERFPRHCRVSDPDMHHGTCLTHVPWCMPGSLTSGFRWRRWREKRSRHSRRMRNHQFYVSGKRPMYYTPANDVYFRLYQLFKLDSSSFRCERNILTWKVICIIIFLRKIFIVRLLCPLHTSFSFVLDRKMSSNCKLCFSPDILNCTLLAAWIKNNNVK